MPKVYDYGWVPTEVQQAVANARQACVSWHPAKIDLPTVPQQPIPAGPLEGAVCSILKDPGFLDHAAWQIAEYSGIFGFLLGAVLIGSGLHRLLLLPVLLPLRIARHNWGVPHETPNR